ncbi:MAG: long-chain fatty acid--CoA ligase, partial [Devosiaceae bacterium]|nr:long-chain fatty acid--CoA ligase [Devosiaceae bacterium]
MSLIAEIQDRYQDSDEPCLLSRTTELRPSDILQIDQQVANAISPGDVVALIGDFDAVSIRRLLTIIDKKAILVPLSASTRPQHEYFFEAAHVDIIIDGDKITRRAKQDAHPMIESLRNLNHPGLVLFSSGTTGLPKAILHDFETFLVRFRTPRPTFRTLNFLLFDHIGGINTLFHTLYNKGTVIFPTSRQVKDIIADIVEFDVELLPTTPTFLRMMLISGILDQNELAPLKVITYGTERMDEPSLQRLCNELPNVAFRQTYGMSELGILRVKSVARDSLWMLVGGEGVETKIIDGILKIRPQNRMVGYLNAPSPFDENGWYDTKDLVETRDDGALRVVGRTTDWINIGGEKVLPGVIEKAALEHSDILLAQAKGVDNPITGQHIELLCQPAEGIEIKRRDMKAW